MLLRTFSLLALAFLALPSARADDPTERVDFAYRNAAGATETERRTVLLQGARPNGFRFDTSCGRAGEHCECLFFRGEMDANPLRSAGSRYSGTLNVFSCTVPGNSVPENLSHVQVRVREGDFLTEKERVRSSLDLQTVIGNLDELFVRSVYRYNCTRTFFEGEGVSRDSLTCMPGQHLGVISATYNFYTFRSHFDGNFPAGDSTWPGPICGRNSFLKMQCTGNTPNLRFGLYKEAKPPFVVAVTLTRAPEGDNLTGVYGYAASPDSGGLCPPGLVKARTYLAQPESITPGSIDGSSPSSSFVNFGDLNNTVLETALPSPFQVTRQASMVPCDTTGSCETAQFGGSMLVQNAHYSPLGQTVCVIPAHLLSGF